MSPYEVLVLAKEKINSPEKWIKGYVAQNANGNVVNPWENDATCFCSVGAIMCVTKNIEDRLEAYKILRNSFPSIFNNYTVASFNDSYATTHDDVMKVFDKAIEAAC